MVSIDKRRLEFGDRLRELYDRAGLTGKALANQLNWNPSKVSRIARGNQLPSDVDLQKWLDACDVSVTQKAALRDELRELRLEYSGWQRQLHGGMTRRQEYSIGLEAAATSFRIVEKGVIPGIAQTAEYARWVFKGVAEIYETTRDIEDAVSTRLRRQDILYDSTKSFEILMFESDLRTSVAPASVMPAQLDRLMSVANLPNVRLGIVVADRQLPFAVMHGFWILDDLAMFEMIGAESTTRDPDEVALHNRIADKLWEVAVVGDEARRVLLSISEHWRELARRAQQT